MQVEKEQNKESNAYSVFGCAVRSQVTRDYYLRRLRIFFNHIDLLSEGSIEERCKNGKIVLKDDRLLIDPRIHEKMFRSKIYPRLVLMNIVGSRTGTITTKPGRTR